MTMEEMHEHRGDYVARVKAAAAEALALNGLELESVRTRANIERFGFAPMLARSPIALLPPQGYLEMLGLLANARVVLTDSGGVQEETTALGVPCLTMRENTERPITVEQGTNTIVGRDRMRIAACVEEILAGGGKRGRVPELWDGRAAQRIADDLERWLAGRALAVEAPRR
jgi:UDP-N-acetylglucosamine 2-epimerase (non-hydrolysing)